MIKSHIILNGWNMYKKLAERKLKLRWNSSLKESKSGQSCLKNNKTTSSLDSWFDFIMLMCIQWCIQFSCMETMKDLKIVEWLDGWKASNNMLFGFWTFQKITRLCWGCCFIQHFKTCKYRAQSANARSSGSARTWYSFHSAHLELLKAEFISIS